MQSIQTDTICLPIPDMYLAEVRFDNTRESETFIVGVCDGAYAE